MRAQKNSGNFRLRLIAGSHVVLMGMNLPRSACAGLLGFSVHRTDHTENEAAFLKGQKCFEKTDPGFPDGEQFTTRDQPVQSFYWADYTAKPDHNYTYTVTALKGAPDNLAPWRSVAVGVVTESAAPKNGTQNIHFNSGVSGSQAYTRRFGDKHPDDVANNKAYEWLSRGLYEAMRAFALRAAKTGFGLRVAAYELHYAPFLEVLAQIPAAGGTLEIVYDRRQESPGTTNEAEIAAAGLAGFCTQRRNGKTFISHNKFMVLLRKGKPVAVWTGGTNFSRSGIFGHSNVAHTVENAEIAGRFNLYWELLKQDLPNAKMRPKVDALSPLPGKLAKGEIATIFSPRTELDALEYYRDLAMRSQDALFMTFAFGINKLFKDVYRQSAAALRFALLEKKTRPLKDGSPEKIAEEAAIDDLRKAPENVFAIGNYIKTGKLDGWVIESANKLSKNVKFIHNKFMLIDPLGANPVVVAGSANFSDASTQDNDENMLVVAGDRRVADIYLGEYMRLFSHHSFREWVGSGMPPDKFKFLRTDDWWAGYFGNEQRSRRRQYFSGVKD